MENKNPWNDDPQQASKRRDDSSKKYNFPVNIGRVLFFCVCALVVGFLLTGLFQVEHDQKGVVLRFGRWVRTVGPGLQYKLPYPFEQAILCRVTTVNQIDLGPNLARSENLVLTGDSNLANFSYNVLWKIKEDDVESFLFNAKNPEATVIAVSESVMREIIGQSDFAFVQTEGRKEIQKKALSGIQTILDEYNIGVEIVKVSLQKVEPPVSVIDSFRDVERAQADQQSERNRAEAYARDTIARTRGIVVEKINKAEAVKAQLIAKAEGEVERFNLIYNAYKNNPAIISKIMEYDAVNSIYAKANKLVIDKDIRSLQHMSIPQSFLNNIGDKK